MKKIEVQTIATKMLADVFTPVGIYLRLRDRFRDTILLESTDHHSAENSFSFIAINAIGGVEIRSADTIEIKYPGQKPERNALSPQSDIPAMLAQYMERFHCETNGIKEQKFAQGLFGYSTYDAVRFFDSIQLRNDRSDADVIPLMRYRFYQYVIAINHFRDELFLLENKIAALESEVAIVEALIRSRDVPVYPFRASGPETTNCTDEEYMDMVEKGRTACHRGDVFQIVVSRRFRQRFTGDEFNVYRALRNINPSPYLFYFDYGDYRLMGSSPEAQLLIEKDTAVVHPIAGTFRRSGDDDADREATQKLLADPKENAEHVMLVDLARNDLSRVCDEVEVTHYREVQYFSHVIHLVSEVKGNVPPGTNPFRLFATTFPAGTLSGAPKFRAMELIDAFEPTARSYYGGAIGFMGFDGSCNHAIMIRSLLSRNNELTYQAGAGVVAASVAENELQEVNNKLGALKRAIETAVNIGREKAIEIL